MPDFIEKLYHLLSVGYCVKCFLPIKEHSRSPPNPEDNSISCSVNVKCPRKLIFSVRLCAFTRKILEEYSCEVKFLAFQHLRSRQNSEDYSCSHLCSPVCQIMSNSLRRSWKSICAKKTLSPMQNSKDYSCSSEVC